MALKVALVIAHQGYQHTEYGEPKKMLEKAGFNVVTVSNKPGVATAKDNSTTLVDVTVGHLNVRDYVGIFFIGGPGALEHLDNQQSYKILQEARSAKIPVGAICIATRILARSGILDGKQATGWDGDNQLAQLYAQSKVSYAPEHVVVCDDIVTAVGPAQAEEFAQALVNLLKDSRY